MTMGERIRSIRKRKGMTQKQVAEKCGMADSAIRKYESGSIVPKFETMERIANALDVPVTAFMGYVYRGTGPDGKDIYTLPDVETIQAFPTQGTTPADSASKQEMHTSIADRFPQLDTQAIESLVKFFSQIPESRWSEVAECVCDVVDAFKCNPDLSSFEARTQDGYFSAKLTLEKQISTQDQEKTPQD